MALIGFGWSIGALADDTRLGCLVNAKPNPAYQALLLSEIDMAKTDYEIAVTRDGQPVSGAKVCATVSMVGMEAMGTSTRAKETTPGTYKVTIVIQMAGSWAGKILIAESGKPRVSAPLKFGVA